MFFVAPQPEITPTGDNEKLNDWVDSQNADLQQFQERYAAAMRLRGVTVTFNRQENVPGPFQLIDPGNATLSRDGVSRDILLSRGRIQLVNMSPEALAAYDFANSLPQPLNQNLANTPNFGPAPTPPVLAPSLSPPLAPTPTVTVTTPNLSSVPTQPPIVRAQDPTVPVTTDPQPIQRPRTPDEGTIISSPEGPYTFEQWNYVFRERTGKIGPDPRAYGINTERRMSVTEYNAILRDLEGETIIPTPPTQPLPNNSTPQPPSNPPSKPKKDDNTGLFIVGAVVLFMLFNR